MVMASILGPSSLQLYAIFGHVVALVHSTEWNYDESSPYGPSKWHKGYVACGGSEQSPIAFWMEDVTVKTEMSELDLRGYKIPIGTGKMKLHNNGHTLQINVPDDVGIKITGGDLPDWYRLVQFHFHWGFNDTQGSEHIVGDNTYPLILHLVHVRHGKHLEHNFDDKEDLAVIAVGFHLAEKPNPELQKIVKHLHEVDFKGEENPIEETLIMKGLIPSDYSNFFRYHGSLTTPPCWESVIWTVLVNTIDVSVDQLHEFRKIYSTPKGAIPQQHMMGNFRPVQALNNRPVYVRMNLSDLPHSPRKSAMALYPSVLSLMLILCHAL